MVGQILLTLYKKKKERPRSRFVAFLKSSNADWIRVSLYAVESHPKANPHRPVR